MYTYLGGVIGPLTKGLCVAIMLAYLVADHPGGALLLWASCVIGGTSSFVFVFITLG